MEDIKNVDYDAFLVLRGKGKFTDDASFVTFSHFRVCNQKNY